MKSYFKIAAKGILLIVSLILALYFAVFFDFFGKPQDHRKRRWRHQGWHRRTPTISRKGALDKIPGHYLEMTLHLQALAHGDRP